MTTGLEENIRNIRNMHHCYKQSKIHPQGIFYAAPTGQSRRQVSSFKFSGFGGRSKLNHELNKHVEKPKIYERNIDTRYRVKG